ncbi:unnamed protein product, partial [Didymodactylos carnosus]
KTKNRLTESCELFQTIIEHKFLNQISIILFLNKHDLLIEKIGRSNIKNWYPEFTGDSKNIEHVKEFILNLFLRYRNQTNMTLPKTYHHYTTAVDTDNIKHVFDTVRQTILQKNINDILL